MIKWNILRIIFKKEFKAMEGVVKQKTEDANRRIRQAELEIEKMKKRYELVERIFENNKNSNFKIIGVEQNKKGQKLLVSEWKFSDSLWIQLHTEHYESIVNLPRIMSTVEGDSIYIDDIIMVEDCVGNGSIAMRYFIKVAKELKIRRIYGDLSMVDKDHSDRLEHFYKKFGFIVNFDYKKIELLLN